MFAGILVQDSPLQAKSNPRSACLYVDCELCHMCDKLAPSYYFIAHTVSFCCIIIWIRSLDNGTGILRIVCHTPISHYLYTLDIPAPKITIKGDEYVRHFQGVPYVDIGAEATLTLANGTVMPIPVKTIANALPPSCETLGLYEIEYEAIGPDLYATPLRGKRATALRIVEIGKYLFAKS